MNARLLMVGGLGLFACAGPGGYYMDATVPVAIATQVPLAGPAGAGAESLRDSCALDVCEDVPATDEPEDGRTHLLQPRAPALLTSELDMLERLLAVTPMGHPDRPKLHRRLAETYPELAEAERQINPHAAVEARNAALRHYAALFSESPGWCMSPGQAPAARGCADEAHYYAAREQEQLGDFGGACTNLYDVAVTADSAYRARACDAMRRIATGF